MLNKRWHFLGFASDYEDKIVNSNGFDYSFFNTTPKQYLNTWGIYDYDFSHEVKDLEVTFAVDDIEEALFISDNFRTNRRSQIEITYGDWGGKRVVDAVFNGATWQEFGKGIRLTVKLICSVLSSSMVELTQHIGGAGSDVIVVDTGEFVGNYILKIRLTSGSMRRIKFNVGRFYFTWNTSLNANEAFFFDTRNIENSRIVNSSGNVRAKLVDNPTALIVENPEQMLITYAPGSNRIVECDNPQNASGTLTLEVGVLAI